MVTEYRPSTRWVAFVLSRQHFIPWRLRLVLSGVILRRVRRDRA